MGSWDFIGWLGLVVIGVSACLIIALNPSCRHRFRLGRSNRRLLSRGCRSLWPETWLAVKSRNLLGVQEALSLHNPRPCSWLEGFTNADTLFVAPPVKGWILVTGRGLPIPSEDVDAWITLNRLPETHRTWGSRTWRKCLSWPRIGVWTQRLFRSVSFGTSMA